MQTRKNKTVDLNSIDLEVFGVAELTEFKNKIETVLKTKAKKREKRRAFKKNDLLAELNIKASGLGIDLQNFFVDFTASPATKASYQKLANKSDDCLD